MSISQKEFLDRYGKAIPLGNKYRIAFYPVFETVYCPICGRKMNKKLYYNANRYFQLYYGINIPHEIVYYFYCPTFHANPVENNLRDSYNVPVKKITIKYEYKKRESPYYNYVEWAPIYKKTVPIDKIEKIKIAVETFRALYFQGFTERQSILKEHLICNIPHFPPLSKVFQENLGDIIKVMQKYGFVPYQVNGKDWLYYNVYNFTEHLIEIYFKHSSGMILKLIIPYQTEERTESWFLLYSMGREEIRLITLIDSLGNEYSFPISIPNPLTFCMKIYSWRRGDKAVSIEEAIQQLDKRMEAEFKPLPSLETVYQRGRELLKEIIEKLPRPAFLTTATLPLTGETINGYLIKGNLGHYFIGIKHTLPIYACKIDHDKVILLKFICLHELNQGESSFVIYDKLVNRIIYLLNDHRQPMLQNLWAELGKYL